MIPEEEKLLRISGIVALAILLFRPLAKDGLNTLGEICSEAIELFKVLKKQLRR